MPSSVHLNGSRHDNDHCICKNTESNETLEKLWGEGIIDTVALKTNVSSHPYDVGVIERGLVVS
jgi:hypothetical protein